MEIRQEEVLKAYIRALSCELDDALFRQTLNRVRSTTRGMSPEEKEAYLLSPAFQNTLRQMKRRDKGWQGLQRGELALAYHQEEFQRLSPLIRAELAQGREVDIAFLRSAERCGVSPMKAHRALRLLETKAPERFFRDQGDRLRNEADRRVDRFLREGEVVRLLPGEPQGEQVLPWVMKTVFARGLPSLALDLAFAPKKLDRMLQEELLRAYPELRQCGRIVLSPTETVSSSVHRKALEASRGLETALRRRFFQERIRRLLSKNPAIHRLQRKATEKYEQERSLRSAMLDAIPQHYRDLYPLAREMRRRFFLHLGPTNSGKTYEGVARLHGALNGIYLGPLRLLAAEQFERLNLDDVPCSLVTGEERILVPGARVQSSTVEMADLKKHYDLAVIDECQMIGDRDRGGAWSAAILGLCAEEIHACASPDAEGLLTRIIRDCGDDLTVVRHERMTPLQVDREPFRFPESVRAGDALIVFSKARVHAVAAELRSRGRKVSLIYGALPPDVRRNQADRFSRGETDVVVSTDAIAMGMNLPIERVVFLESEKFDGDITRTLTDAEIKQIAGRAGRYGIYDVGHVNAFGFRPMIAQALARPLLPLTEAVIRFPDSLLGVPLSLSQTLEQWVRMADQEGFTKASTLRMANLTAMLESPNADKERVYRFVCIPFDETDPDLLIRWRTLYHLEEMGEHADILPEMPEIRDPDECTVQMLDGLEADYRRCDLYYNYARLFLPEPEKLLEEIQRRKDLISQGIIHILSTQKLQQKTCRSCRRRLPWNWPWPLCENCHRRQNAFHGRR